MAISYSYQQNVFEGASYGYVQYNISPSFGTYVSPGTQVTLQIKMYNKNMNVNSIQVNFRDASGNVRDGFVLDVSMSKGNAKTGKIKFTMWQLNSSWGSDRTFSIYPFFTFWSGSGGTGSGEDTIYSTSQAISYLAYKIDPSFNALSFERYENSGSSYVKNDEGIFVLGRIKIAMDDDYSVSDITIAKAEVKDENDTLIATKNLSSSVLTSALSASGYNETSPGIFSDIIFDSSLDYSIIFTIGDSYSQASATIEISRAFANIHLSGHKTGGVAFGKFSSSELNDPKFECEYPAYLSGGIGELGNISGSQMAIGMQYGSVDAVSVGDDKLVQTTITFKRKYALPPIVICTVITDGDYHFNDCTATISSVDINGFVLNRRNRSGSSRSFGVSWIALGQPNTDPNSWGVITLKRPAAAMTSNNSQNCVASASTVYSDSYKAYQAFSSSREKGWASKDSDSQPWLQLQMDVALTNIVVKVYSRDNSNIYNPTAGTIQGSNDGSTWTNIGSFSGWSSTARNALLGTVECKNTTAYGYVRIVITSRTDSSHYAAIGHVDIEGDYTSS